MTITEAIKLLREYNRWRRGADIPMPKPDQIGRALDVVCDYAEGVEREAL